MLNTAAWQWKPREQQIQFDRAEFITRGECAQSERERAFIINMALISYRR